MANKGIVLVAGVGGGPGFGICRRFAAAATGGPWNGATTNDVKVTSRPTEVAETNSVAV